MGLYVVTGAGSGIGAGTAGFLKEQGHTVIGVDLKNTDISADLSSPEGRQKVVEQLQPHIADGIDGLVTCAGVGPNTDPLSLIPKVNYFGTTELVAALQPALEKRRGAVVIVASNSAIWDSDPAYLEALSDDNEKTAAELAPGLEGQILYQGSKKALARWMRRQVPALAAKGIRINAIAPGFTYSNMTKSGLEDPKYKQAIEQFLASIPLARGGQPKDMAEAVSFLLSNERAGFITGSVLFIDGGHDATFRPDLF